MPADARGAPFPPPGALAGADSDSHALAVECRDLVVRYGNRTAVDRLSLTGRRGEVLALLGPNGAGKTSTVECLEGYRRPESGSVAVLGLDPVADHRRLVPRIGVMLQRGGVYPMLGPRRALELFASYYDDPADPVELLGLAGLAGVARTPWRHLSGGEQARLSLALALVGRPEVVFLDEPTAGVDPGGRLAVRAVIDDLRGGGACVVLTTHELAEAERLADAVVVVHQGKVVAHGTPAGLAGGAGGADEVSFGAPSGLDVVALSAALGASVAEEAPGRYRLRSGASPALTAALTAWLAERDTVLTDLRIGRTLEEAYLEVVGADGGTEGVNVADQAQPGGRPPRGRGRGDGSGRGHGDRAGSRRVGRRARAHQGR